MSGIERSRYEARLHTAQRALWAAQEAAEVRGDQGAVEDIAAIRRELTRLMELSLRGKRAPMKGQLEPLG